MLTRVSRGRSGLITHRSSPASASPEGREPTWRTVWTLRATAAVAVGVGLGVAVAVAVAVGVGVGQRRRARRAVRLVAQHERDRRGDEDQHAAGERGTQRRGALAVGAGSAVCVSASAARPGSVGAASGAAAPRATIRSGSVGERPSAAARAARPRSPADG